MTITARKYALMRDISPKARQLAGLYVLEIVTVLSWTLLLDTIFKLLSGSWLMLLPVSYLFAVSLLAWLERPRKGTGENNPLEAFGLAEVSLKGTRHREWQTLRRLFFTIPLLMLLCIGLLPIPGTGRTLLQLISGTRIVPLDTSMDPRPDEEIYRNRRKALMKVIASAMLSLMVASVIALVPPKLSRPDVQGRIATVHELPEEERQLLAGYLEMKALYPDCLEFRVRLASLYYRNDMREDLLSELAYIRTKDPDHAILLLGEDLSVSMDELVLSRDSAFADSFDIIEADSEAPAAADSEQEDTTDAAADTTILDLTPVSTDSVAVQDTISQTADLLPPDGEYPEAQDTDQEPDDGIIEDYSDSISSVSPDSTPTVPVPDTSGAAFEEMPTLPDTADLQDEGLDTQQSNQDSTQSHDSQASDPTDLPDSSTVSEEMTDQVETSSEPSGDTGPEETTPDEEIEPQPEGP